MSSENFSCSCQCSGSNTAANAENDVVLEYPCTTNFEIIPFKPLKEILLKDKSPLFKYKYFEDIEKTLRESCDFEDINKVLYYLKRNPNIYDIVPRLLEFLSCELNKEGQQRAPILLKALYCLYINSVSAKSDFSICVNALEHFLTNSPTFPGDYVVKDIAADILSDFCATIASDDLKEHVILQLSRVLHNPKCHSYNLYGGIVGCTSVKSVKSIPEVLYDAFYSDTFLRNLLSSPRMLKKLFCLCKPFIYSRLPNIQLPMLLHDRNSFCDADRNYARVFNLMRNEIVTPLSYVKYDHMFSEDYEFKGGWFEDTNAPINCQDPDLIWPGFSAFKRAQMLEKNADGGCSSKSGGKGNTDDKTYSYMDIDEAKSFHGSEFSGDSENSEREGTIQLSSTSGSSTDDTDSERNLESGSGEDTSSDISVVTIIPGKSNLLAERLGQCDRKQPLQDDSKPTEHIEVQRNRGMRYVGSSRIEKCNPSEEIQSQKCFGFRSHDEYADYLAWKRGNTYPEFHSYNLIGETLCLIPPPAHIDMSMFEHRDEDYSTSVPDSHIISSEYITEESLTAENHCCQRSNISSIPSPTCSSHPDSDIFKDLDKHMFANWEYKKPKIKRQISGAEKSDTKSQSQKKKKRGKKRY